MCSSQCVGSHCCLGPFHLRPPGLRTALGSPYGAPDWLFPSSGITGPKELQGSWVCLCSPASQLWDSGCGFMMSLPACMAMHREYVLLKWGCSCECCSVSWHPVPVGNSHPSPALTGHFPLRDWGPLLWFFFSSQGLNNHLGESHWHTPCHFWPIWLCLQETDCAVITMLSFSTFMNKY